MPAVANFCLLQASAVIEALEEPETTHPGRSLLAMTGFQRNGESSCNPCDCLLKYTVHAI